MGNWISQCSVANYGNRGKTFHVFFSLNLMIYLNYSVFPRVKHILQIKCSQLGAPV